MSLPRVVAGRYRLDALLGEGGMGQVHRAWDERLRRFVAVKTVKDPTGMGGASSTALTLKEARAAAALNHANVVSIHDFGEDDGTPFVVMELVEGKNLRTLVGRAPSIEIATSWLIDVARALEAAHAVGLVHRDIKPENVVLRDDGVIKVLDFGIAKRHASSGDTAGSTLPGRVVGTVGYMAPEQLRGERVDPRVDQFAWGVLAYELLTGTLPWGIFESPFALAVAVLTEPVRPPSTQRKEISAHLDRVILRALEKEPSARFDTMSAVLASIAPARVGISVPPPGSTVSASALASAATEAALAPFARAFPASLVPPSDTAPQRIHDATHSPTSSDVASRAYRSALVRFRSANWPEARAALETAVEADPSFASALLRLAITGAFARHGLADERRLLYRRLLPLLDHLPTRDRALFRAVEPLIFLDPPDVDEGERRMQALGEGFNEDAELTFLSALFVQDLDPRAALDRLARATTIDPEYADALQLRGRVCMMLGRTDEARAALERCVALVPDAADGYNELAILAAESGDAKETERLARKSIWIVDELQPYEYLLRATFARTTRLDALTAIAEAEAQASPEAQRRARLARRKLQIAIARGDFAAASVHLRDLRETAGGDAGLELASSATALGIRVAWELHDIEEAGTIAMRYLDARSAKVLSIRSGEPVPVCLAAAVRANRLTHEVARRELLSFYEQRNPTASPGSHWAATFGPWLDGEADVDLARELAPPADRFWFKPGSAGVIDAGLALLRIGEVERAVPLLRRGAVALIAPSFPFRATLVHEWLGEACEKLGDVAGAARSYETLLARWGAGASASAKRVELRLTRLARGA